VSFVAITLCVASQLEFLAVVYFVIDSVRKLFNTPSCVCVCVCVGGGVFIVRNVLWLTSLVLLPEIGLLHSP
jgi:hypothetical protein